MIELALVPIALGLIALIAWQQQQFGLREKEWIRERQILITRLQHPEVVPIVKEATEMAEEMLDDPRSAPEPDDIDLVGTVQTFDGSSD